MNEHTGQAGQAKRVMRLVDLADYFQVKRTTIYEWRRAGKLDKITHLDPGGHVYFLADEVDAWARKRDLALSEMTREAVA